MSDCLFCKIINKEIPSDIVFENDNIIAFKDINPKAKVHILIIPKKHIVSVGFIEKGDSELIAELLFTVKQIAKETKIDKSGYKLITNIGSDGGQLIFHLHFHLLGGEKITGIV